jgi:hypothetical protein
MTATSINSAAHFTNAQMLIASVPHIQKTEHTSP